MKKLILFTFSFLFSFNLLHATAINSTATGGVFGDTASWVGGVVPTLGDTLTIVAGATVYWDGISRTIGTAILNNDAMTINGSFIVPYNVPASTLSVTGDIQVADGAFGTFQAGDYSTPYLSTNTFTVNLMESGTAKPKFIVEQGPNGGRCYLYGSIYMNEYSTTTTKTITSSYASSASSQVACEIDIDAKAGQKYMIACTHAIADTEILTVANYDRSTKLITFTNNFTKSHSTGTPIGLLSGNIIIKSTSTATTVYFQKDSNTTLANQNCLYWDRVELNIGNTAQSAYILGSSVTIKNSAIYNSGPFYIYAGNGAVITDNIFCNNHPGSTYLFATDTGGSSVVADGNYFFSTTGARAPIYDLGSNNTYRNCWFGGASAQAFYCSGGFNTTIETSSFTCIATNIFYLTATNISINTKNCYYVQLSTNTSDTPNQVFQQNALYKEITYSDSGSIWYDVIAATPSASGGFFKRDFDYTSGSIWKCENYQGITGNDRYYTGSYMVLRDTNTIRTAGSDSINVNIGAYPAYLWNTNPAYVKFPLPCNANDTILIRGYVRKNSLYGSSNLPAIQAVFSYDLDTTYSASMTDIDDTWDLVTFGTTAASTGTVTISLYAYNESKTVGATCWFSDVRAYIGNSVYALSGWTAGYPQASPVAFSIDTANFETEFDTVNNNINTSSNTLSGQISGISVDVTPIITAINTSSNTIVNEIHSSSMTVNDIFNKTIRGRTFETTIDQIRRRVP